ncbi:head-tail adaptor protein [Sphingomonas yunnanensis]|uniref:phage head completion protein n=1 Tax=Sphingomonas yunnanensis TaxID=310400 RepID=UPI001CA66342|nr:head-tail adaptor protein [Sphingomonas yunnanensis]MBY9062304.1 head-tail adaptor protein [Sphingomonas yunnanensis]
MPSADLGPLDDRVRIERPAADDALDGAGADTWAEFAEVWASILDMLPSRGERLAEGLNVATRPARVRLRHLDGVTNAMRLVLLRWDVATEAWVAEGRLMQIITVPAEIGRRDGLEMMVEDYSPSQAAG